MTAQLESALGRCTDGSREPLPGSEAGVSEVLTQSCRDAFNLPASGVWIEAPWRGRWLDVRVEGPVAALELKYHCRRPDTHNRPLAMQHGQLRTDVCKLDPVDDGFEISLTFREARVSSVHPSMFSRGLCTQHLRTPVMAELLMLHRGSTTNGGRP